MIINAEMARDILERDADDWEIVKDLTYMTSEIDEGIWLECIIRHKESGKYYQLIAEDDGPFDLVFPDGDIVHLVEMEKRTVTKTEWLPKKFIGEKRNESENRFLSILKKLFLPVRKDA